MIKRHFKLRLTVCFICHHLSYLFFDLIEIIKQVYRSCRHVHPSSGDGEYSIDPTMSGNPFTVYCDMTTDGGKYIIFFK